MQQFAQIRSWFTLILAFNSRTNGFLNSRSACVGWIRPIAWRKTPSCGILTLYSFLKQSSESGVTRPVCCRWSWASWGRAWRQRSRWSCCCSRPACEPPDPADSCGRWRSGWSRAGRWGCWERAEGGDRKHQFYSETVKTRQMGINVFNSPRVRGVCRTDSQVVWRHRQVCALFAGRKVNIRNLKNLIHFAAYSDQKSANLHRKRLFF